MESATLSKDPRPTYRLLQAVASALAHAGRRANLEGQGDGSAFFAAARAFSPGSPTYARLLRAGTRETLAEEIEALLAGADPAVRRVIEGELEAVSA